ncbi:hypothetical protein GQX74_015059 [Glossina fuscipes]|nr:hypothetical protein GQX74_015059 [Glossina fuscipes]
MIKQVVDNIVTVFEQLSRCVMELIISYIVHFVVQVSKFFLALVLIFGIGYGTFYLFTPRKIAEKVSRRHGPRAMARSIYDDDEEIWDMEKEYARILREEAFEREIATTLQMDEEEEDSFDRYGLYPKFGSLQYAEYTEYAEQGEPMPSQITSARVREVTIPEAASRFKEATERVLLEKNRPQTLSVIEAEPILTTGTTAHPTPTAHPAPAAHPAPTAHPTSAPRSWSNMEDHWARIVKKIIDEQDKLAVQIWGQAQKQEVPAEFKDAGCDRYGICPQFMQEPEKKGDMWLDTEESDEVLNVADQEMDYSQIYMKGTPRVRRITSDGSPSIRESFTFPESEKLKTQRVRRRLLDEFKSEEKDMSSLSPFAPPLMSTPPPAGLLDESTAYVIDDEMDRSVSNASKSSSKRTREDRPRLQRGQRMDEIESDETKVSKRLTATRQRAEISKDESTADKSFSKRTREGRPPLQRRQRMDEIESDESDDELTADKSSFKRTQENRPPLQRRQRMDEIESDESDDELTADKSSSKRTKEGKPLLQRGQRMDEIETDETGVPKPAFVPPTPLTAEQQCVHVSHNVLTPRRPREERGRLRRRNLLHEFESEDNDIAVPISTVTPIKSREDRPPLRRRRLLDEFEGQEMEEPPSHRYLKGTPKIRHLPGDELKLKNKYEDEAKDEDGGEDESEDKDEDADMDVDDEEMEDIEKGYARMLKREAQEEYLKMMTRGALERQFAETWKTIAKKEDKPVSTDAQRQKTILARHDELTEEEIGDKLEIPETAILEKSRRLGSLVDWWKKKTRRISPSRRIHKEEIGDMGAKKAKSLKTEKMQGPHDKYRPFPAAIDRREDGLTESEELFSENDLTTSRMYRSRIPSTRKDGYEKYRWSNMEEEWARMVKKKQETLEKKSVDTLKESQKQHGPIVPQKPIKEDEVIASERIRPPAGQRWQNNHKEQRSELSSSESPIPHTLDRRKGENSKDVRQMKEELVETPRIKALEKAFEILLQEEARKREQHVEENIDDVARMWTRLMKRDALEKAFTTILEREQKNDPQSSNTLIPRSTSDEYIGDVSRSAFMPKYSKQAVDVRLERYPNDVHLKGTPKVRRLGADMRSHSVPPYETPRTPQANGLHLPRRKLLNEFEAEMPPLQDKSTADTLSSDEIESSIPKAAKRHTFLHHRRSSSERPVEDRLPLQRIKRIGGFAGDEIDESISIFAPALIYTPERQREETSHFPKESTAYRIDPYEMNSSTYSTGKKNVIIPSSKRPREDRPPSKRSGRVEKFEVNEIDESVSTSALAGTSTPKRLKYEYTSNIPHEDRRPIRRRKLLDEFDLEESDKSSSKTRSN